jgi:hypothetical protein
MNTRTAGDRFTAAVTAAMDIVSVRRTSAVMHIGAADIHFDEAICFSRLIFRSTLRIPPRKSR